MTATYRIERMFFNTDYRTRVIKRGLTLEQAQAHCQDPETSSKTATKPSAKRRTEQMGPWFDGYEEERS